MGLLGCLVELFGCRGIWRIFDIYKEVVGGGALEEQEIPILGFNRI